MLEAGIAGDESKSAIHVGEFSIEPHGNAAPINLRRTLAWKETKSSGTGPPSAALLPALTCSRKFLRKRLALSLLGLVVAGPPTFAPGRADRTPATA